LLCIAFAFRRFYTSINHDVSSVSSHQSQHAPALTCEESDKIEGLSTNRHTASSYFEKISGVFQQYNECAKVWAGFLDSLADAFSVMTWSFSIERKTPRTIMNVA
jgi:hypothetical protein